MLLPDTSLIRITYRPIWLGFLPIGERRDQLYKDYLQTMNPNTYIPVLAPNNTPLMPCKYRRAQKLVEQGEAQWISNDLNIKAICLLREPSAYNTQPIALGVDPGKHFTGMGLVSKQATLLLLHLILPFEKVKARKSAQRILRRTRRGRRINRKVAFPLRAHRQQRFNNRRQKKLSPSILANKRIEQRCITEIFRLFPVASVVWEVVKADVDRTSGRKKARSGKGFSPVMVGQKIMLQWLRQFTVVHEMRGYQTKAMREQLGLVKSHNKKKQTPHSHAIDGLALAASKFVQYESFRNGQEHGHHWTGEIRLTSAPFRVIARPAYYRRQLHFENFSQGGTRKRKGGTVTPFGFRCGDFVQAEKAGQTYRGWIGGYTHSQKTKNVSVYNHEWKRIGQFSPAKVQLIKRKSGLCVA